MIEQAEIKHHIQKHIIGVLLHQRTARFRDMRAPRVDSNLYSYHLKQLINAGFVKKSEGVYTLDSKGLMYVDRLSINKLFVRTQPKIITMLVIQNDYGDVLMYPKLRQPFIEQWTIPNGKVHNDDASVGDAARREVAEKIGGLSLELHHAGDCYIRIMDNDMVVMTMLAHVFYGTTDDFEPSGHVRWVKLRDLERLDTAPAVKEIIARTLFRDPFFFEEFSCEG